MDRLYRIQDAEGRGPFRPGFSHVWLDKNGPPLPPSIVEMPGFSAIVARAHRQNLHIGTAVVGNEALNKWFSSDEMLRLARLGYRVVDATSCKVVARDSNQVLITSPLPLRLLPAAKEPTP